MMSCTNLGYVMRTQPPDPLLDYLMYMYSFVFSSFIKSDLSAKVYAQVRLRSGTNTLCRLGGIQNIYRTVSRTSAPGRITATCNLGSGLQTYGWLPFGNIPSDVWLFRTSKPVAYSVGKLTRPRISSSTNRHASCPRRLCRQRP